MLVLTRKVGEKIILSNGVEITVERVMGRHVKLGVVAPDVVRIFRSEIASKPPKQGPSNCKCEGIGPESMPDSGLPLV